MGAFNAGASTVYPHLAWLQQTNFASSPPLPQVVPYHPPSAPPDDSSDSLSSNSYPAASAYTIIAPTPPPLKDAPASRSSLRVIASLIWHTCKAYFFANIAVLTANLVKSSALTSVRLLRLDSETAILSTLFTVAMGLITANLLQHTYGNLVGVKNCVAEMLNYSKRRADSDKRGFAIHKTFGNIIVILVSAISAKMLFERTSNNFFFLKHQIQKHSPKAILSSAHTFVNLSMTIFALNHLYSYSWDLLKDIPRAFGRQS